MKDQYLAVGQDVIYVSTDKKEIKAKITQVFNEDEASLSWENGGAIAKYSEDPLEGTFHFEQASPEEEE